MAKKQTPKPAPKKSNPNAMVGKGAYNMLEEVQVKAKATPKASAPMPKASVSSALTSLPTLKAPTPAGPKKLGRLATAASDATSAIRGAANLAFGKNQSKTTGGKILERGARLGAAALGIGIAKKAAVAGATKAISTASKAGSVNPIGQAILTAGTVAAGQAAYKKRSAESTRTGLLNPGKGKANIGINFDKPFQKAKRDYPLSESPNPEFNNQK
jgi:hypothetical protein